MSRNSLIAIGRQAFEVLIRIENKKPSEIAKALNVKTQTVNKIKNSLFDAGWISETKEPKITEAGKYFIKTIYLNKKINLKS